MEVRFDAHHGAYHWADEWWGFERGETHGFASLIAGDTGMSDPGQLLASLDAAASVSAEGASQHGGTTYHAEVPLTSVSVQALAVVRRHLIS